MRIFVGAWPSEAVLDVLAALPRPDAAPVRWTRPDQWHVTLRFLGEVDEGDLGEVVGAVQRVAAEVSSARATVGPATTMLGGVLVAPVAGIGDIAARVIAATAGIGQPPDPRPFDGHITIGRSTGRRGRVPRALAGTPITASWSVHEIAVIRSHLGGGPARYETIAAGAIAP